MIPLVAPCITKHDRKYMVDRVTDGLLEDESEVRRFEEAFAARVGCEWAVAVNSGTMALVVAMDTAGAGQDRVISLPSFSCAALRNAAHALGAKIEYVDTEWNVHLATALVEPVDVLAHMFGRPTSTGYAPLIEDLTLSLGGVSGLGSMLLRPSYAAIWGTDSILGACSTHASKMISTGRGGVIVGNDDDHRDRVRERVDYESHEGFGYSVGMSSTQAALGVSQIGQLDAFIERRRELAAGYTGRFRAAGIDCPDADCGSVFFRYIIRVTDPVESVQRLAERGIEAGRGVYPPLHRLAGLPDTDFPGTTAAVESLLSVPVHPSITDAEADHIIESVLEVCAP